MNNKHIVKYVAVFIKDKKFLVVRQKDENFWKNVGGRVENNETPEECLKREVKEELGLELTKEPKFYFSLPTTKAASDPTISLDMHLYFCEADGEPTPSSEIGQIHWISKEDFDKDKFEVTSQIKEYIIPRLIADQLI